MGVILGGNINFPTNPETMNTPFSTSPANGSTSVPFVQLAGANPSATTPQTGGINPISTVSTIANNYGTVSNAITGSNPASSAFTGQALGGSTVFNDGANTTANISYQSPFSGAANSLENGTFTGTNAASTGLAQGEAGASGASNGLSLTGGLADAGASLGGNMLANAVFGSNRGAGASIGGTVGGIAGSAIGGPIGGAVGSFLGNFVGGLFSGGQGTQAAEFSSTVGANGQLANLTFGNDKSNSAEQKFTQGLTQSVSQTLGVLGSQGVDLSKLQLHGGYNSVQAGGAFIDVGLQGQDPTKLTRIKFDSSDATSTTNALGQLGQTALGLLGDNSKTYAQYAQAYQASTQNANATNPSNGVVAGSNTNPNNSEVTAAFGNAPSIGANTGTNNTQFSQFVQNFRNTQNTGAVKNG